MPSVNGDRDTSLKRMRMAMLKGSTFVGAAFIGGMEGIVDEFDMFRDLHPRAPIVLVDSAGGATQTLAAKFPAMPEGGRQPFDYYGLFSERLGISLEERRHSQME